MSPIATPLRSMNCVACRKGEPTVTDAEMAELLPEIPDWDVVERDEIKRLERRFTFPDFAAALAFTNRVGALAEEEGHHPALLTEWGKVTVTWWTIRYAAFTKMTSSPPRKLTRW